MGLSVYATMVQCYRGGVFDMNVASAGVDHEEHQVGVLQSYGAEGEVPVIGAKTWSYLRAGKTIET